METDTASGGFGSRPLGSEVEDAKDRKLVAVTRRDGNTVPSLGATARQHSGACLRLHARAESMHLGAATAVGLKGTLGHRTVLVKRITAV